MFDRWKSIVSVFGGNVKVDQVAWKPTIRIFWGRVVGLLYGVEDAV